MKYFYRITDRIFILYKISNRTSPCIKEVDACVAYNKYGDYSDKVKRLLKKVNNEDIGFENTANSHEDFCNRLYLRNKNIFKTDMVLGFSSKILKELEFNYNLSKK